MEYKKNEAKDWAKQHIHGIWVASTTPFNADYSIDEAGIKHNIRYLLKNLHVAGVFLNGLMGEAFYQTLDERKRVIKAAIEENNGKMVMMPYTSDNCLENAILLTKHAEQVGADLVVIINPMFYFGGMTEEGVFQYYKYIADRVNIGMVLFNQMEHKYLMSPGLISRLADIPNIVAIKDVAPTPELMDCRRLCDDRIIVSDVLEDNWLNNLVVKGQAAFVANPQPYLLQSEKLKLMEEYTDAAISGNYTKAFEASKRMEPLRKALKRVTFPGKMQASFKYWSKFLGMAGGEGRVRLPQIGLTDHEKREIEQAIAETGLL